MADKQLSLRDNKLRRSAKAACLTRTARNLRSRRGFHGKQIGLARHRDRQPRTRFAARGFLGRLDPATGKVSEWQSPGGPRSQPYGIVATKGALWYSESFTKPNTIVRFDPTSQTFQSWAIPGGGEIVRNMAVTGEGNVALANSLVNEVGLVEIK